MFKLMNFFLYVTSFSRLKISKGFRSCRCFISKPDVVLLRMRALVYKLAHYYDMLYNMLVSFIFKRPSMYSNYALWVNI